MRICCFIASTHPGLNCKLCDVNMWPNLPVAPLAKPWTTCCMTSIAVRWGRDFHCMLQFPETVIIMANASATPTVCKFFPRRFLYRVSVNPQNKPKG